MSRKFFSASIFIQVFICHSGVYSTELIQRTAQRLPFHAFIWAPAANQSTAISTPVRQFGCRNINNNEEKHNLCLNKQHSRNLFFLFDNNVCVLIKVCFPAPLRWWKTNPVWARWQVGVIVQIVPGWKSNCLHRCRGDTNSPKTIIFCVILRWSSLRLRML